MTGFLKEFIAEQNLNLEYAQRFLLYQDRYHHQVFLDLKKTLEKEWSKETKKLSTKFKIKPDDLDFALLQNPKATVQLSVDSSVEKVSSSRHRDPVDATLSVKIPLVMDREERDHVIKEILTLSSKVFKSITEQWSEIFKLEKNGKMIPCFKIVDDHQEIRLQFCVSSGNHEIYKTIYSIRVDFGKKSSKLRDFDRIYLVSLL